MSSDRRRAAVIGLGSMGYGMAQSLMRAQFAVVGCDVSAASMQRFKEDGGEVARTPAEAVAGADVVVCVVVSAAQTEAVLFGPEGVAEAMPPGAVFMSAATMDPEIAKRLAARLEATGRHYLDAPISGGPVKAANGDMSIVASGTPAAFKAADAALSAMASKIYRLGDAAGPGSAFKMINQLLAGVHIAVASEAMAFAAHQGLDLAKVYEVITGSAGNSWMFENRMTHVVSGDYTPLSTTEIFIKDLGIVQDMARAARYPAPIAATALQMYLAAAGSGMGQDADASVARVYAQMSGATLPEKKK